MDALTTILGGAVGITCILLVLLVVGLSVFAFFQEVAEIVITVIGAFIGNRIVQVLFGIGLIISAILYILGR